MPDFSDTAAYFEAKARKTSDEDRRHRFADTARFYRRLAQITPTFPWGYKSPETRGGRETRLRNRAEECRAMAAVMRDAGCRAKLLDLAKTYEQVADGPAIAGGACETVLRELSRKPETNPDQIAAPGAHVHPLSRSHANGVQGSDLAGFQDVGTVLPRQAD